MNHKLQGVEFLGIEFYMDGDVEIGNLNIGAVTISHQGREVMLDVVQTMTMFNGSETHFECQLETVDETIEDNTFDGCKYDLLPEDLNESHNTLFLDGEDAPIVPMRNGKLIVRVNGELKELPLHEEDDDDVEQIYKPHYDHEHHLDLVRAVMELRSDWQRIDFKEAYGDEWDDIDSKTIPQLREQMEEHLNLTYDDALLKEIIEEAVEECDIAREDIESVSQDIFKLPPTEHEVAYVVKNFDIQAEADPTGDWRIWIEDLLYELKSNLEKSN